MKWLCLGFLILLGGGASGTAQTNPAAPDISFGGASVVLTADEQAWLKAHPVVHWGGDPHWPPFSSVNARGEIVGIDADITRLVAQRVGLRILRVPSDSWADTVAKARAGEVDFVSGAAKTKERMERMTNRNFSVSYGAFPVVIITRKDVPFMTSMHRLRTAKIAMPRDYVTTEQVHRDFPEAQLVLTDTVDQSLLMVVGGEADASVCNLAVASHIIRLRAMANLKISGVTHYEFPLRFAARKDWPELISILNKGLATLSVPEEEKIFARHITPDVASARDWGAWRRRALFAVLGGILISGALFCWNRFQAVEIQRRKAAELALREARDKLDVQVQKAERLNEQLRITNSDLESFSWSVSHDLRAPLRQITSFAGLLEEQLKNRLDTSDRELFSVITGKTKRMDHLIHDLLAFSRLGRAELTKAPVNMQHLVDSTIEDLGPQFKGRDVAWDIGPLPEVIGDNNLLRQVMVNMIDNALKYTRERPHTEIQVKTLPGGPGDKEVVFYVRDNGCGFDMNLAHKLFRPFERFPNSVEYEGTGIGLANVQKIIQRHGGRIWAESEVDKGTTFYFSLTRSIAT